MNVGKLKGDCQLLSKLHIMIRRLDQTKHTQQLVSVSEAKDYLQEVRLVKATMINVYKLNHSYHYHVCIVFFIAGKLYPCSMHLHTNTIICLTQAI